VVLELALPVAVELVQPAAVQREVLSFLEVVLARVEWGCQLVFVQFLRVTRLGELDLWREIRMDSKVRCTVSV